MYHKDSIYNLMAQLITEQKSLYRIKEMYKQDSAGDEEQTKLWDQLEEQKETNVKSLTELIKKQLN